MFLRSGLKGLVDIGHSCHVCQPSPPIGGQPAALANGRGETRISSGTGVLFTEQCSVHSVHYSALQCTVHYSTVH